MEQKQEDIKRLIDHVEKVMGKSMQAPRDFMMLYEQLKDFTGDSISISTLKRIWGYTHTDTSFSLHSLDLLSRMVGYNNWDSFLKDESDIPTSQVFDNKKLKSFSLEPDEKMKLTWQPNRVVLVEYQGCNKFKVLESQNSKLQTGDVFHCEQFMESKPLIMTHSHQYSNRQKERFYQSLSLFLTLFTVDFFFPKSQIFKTISFYGKK